MIYSIIKKALLYAGFLFLLCNLLPQCYSVKSGQKSSKINSIFWYYLYFCVFKNIDIYG